MFENKDMGSNSVFSQVKKKNMTQHSSNQYDPNSVKKNKSYMV